MDTREKMLSWLSSRKDHHEDKQSNRKMAYALNTPRHGRRKNPPSLQESEAVSVRASRNGIEMSLSQESFGEKESLCSTTHNTTPDSSSSQAIATLSHSHLGLCWSHEITVRSKIHKTVFNVGNWPLLDNGIANAKVHDQLQATRRRHRVPLMQKNQKSNLLFDDILFLLRGHPVQDEKTAVREEVGKLREEIKELNKDKADLESAILRLPPEKTLASTKMDAVTQEWDVYRALSMATLTSQQQQSLQEMRGTDWTIGLGTGRQDSNSSGIALEALLKCLGGTVSKATRTGDCWTLTSRGHSVAHTCIWKSSKDTPAFFLSRDKQLSSHHGLWPNKLLNRIKNENLEFSKQRDFTYLALGDWDQYYGVLRSGETWWGTVDSDLDAVLQEWDCHRVVFGPSQVASDPRSPDHPHYHTSWIVVSKDGRVAWKNIPSQLEEIFSCRLATKAGVAEVSLGYSGAFFVRFLDGTTHFSLPSHVADACRRLEQQGQAITMVVLHSELCHDFIIRSSSSAKRR